MLIVRKVHVISALFFLFEKFQYIERNLDQCIVHVIHRRQFAFDLFVRIGVERAQIVICIFHFILRVRQLFFLIRISDLFEK